MDDNDIKQDAFREFLNSLAYARTSVFSSEKLSEAAVSEATARLRQVGGVSELNQLARIIEKLESSLEQYSRTAAYLRNATELQKEQIQKTLETINALQRSYVTFSRYGKEPSLGEEFGMTSEDFEKAIGTGEEAFNKVADLMEFRVGKNLEDFARATEIAARTLRESLVSRNLSSLINLEEAQKATYLKNTLSESPVAVAELFSSGYLQTDKYRKIFGDNFIQSFVQSANLNRQIYNTAKQIQEGTGFFESFFINSSEISKIQKETLSSFFRDSQQARVEYKKSLQEIDEIIKSPKSSEEEIAKQIEKRKQIQKQLLDITLDELNVRKKLFDETYGKLGQVFKNIGLRELDYIGSTTRNPFWDILNSSLKFGIQTGVASFQALSSMMNNLGSFDGVIPAPVPGIPAGRGTGRAPTPTAPAPGTPTQTPTPGVPAPNQNTPNSSSGQGSSRVPGSPSVASAAKSGLISMLVASGLVAMDYFSGDDVRKAQIQKEFPRTASSIVGTGVGAASAGLIGGAIGSLFGPVGTSIGYLLGNVVGGIGGGFAGLKIFDFITGGKEKEEQKKNLEANVADISKNIPNLSKNILDLAKTLNINAGDLSTILGGSSLGSILALGSFGSGGNFLSKLIGNVLGKGLPLLGGSVIGAGAFLLDFYLQSLNKSYDIYYSQFVQQNLIPQTLRTPLGNNVSDISRILLMPGGLLKSGQNSLLNLGYAREEMLATIPRITSSIFVQSTSEMAQAVKDAGSAARVFGTAIGDSVSVIASARKSLLDYKDIFGIARVISGGENFTQFTKAVTESFINASLSLATRQNLNPMSYVTSLTSIFSILTSNRSLENFVRQNPEIAASAFQSINEFIRGGITNPVSGGMAYRAGLTPRDVLSGATPGTMFNVLRQLVRETGISGQVVGGRLNSQAVNYLMPLLQQQLGLGNIAPDIFNEIVLSIATGRDNAALSSLRRATARGAPTALPSDINFGKQQEELVRAFQQLTEVMKPNIETIVKLNAAITDLSASILRLGEGIGQFAVSGVATAVDVASNVATGATNAVLGKPTTKSLPPGVSSLANPTIPPTSSFTDLGINQRLAAGQNMRNLGTTINANEGTVFFTTGSVTAIPIEDLKKILSK